jgi:CDP-glucose 4,6-dehydratase
MENVVNQQTLQSYYRGKNVFITGHTGFKGSWLMAWLRHLGASVHGYALEPEYADCLFNQLAPEQKGESVIADIRDAKKLEAEILSFAPDYIFHLAAQPLVRRSYEIPAETFAVNAIGTANLLEAVTKLEKKCSVLVITTDKVYENKEQDILYTEDDVLGGYDPYSASKACTELVVNSFRNSFFHIHKTDQHKKGIVTVRAGNVIGGGDFSKDRIIPDIINALKAQKAIEVRNPGAVRPWQHVLEPLGGYLLLGGLLHGDPVRYSGAYNFGPEPADHLTVKELAELAIASWKSGEWKATGDSNQPHEAGLLKLDISKAKNTLHWRPKLNAATAIRWTINWYRQNENIPAFTLQQIQDYMRL